MHLITTSRGFTLLEIIITVAIISILAAIAYPSYQNSILKSRRADAKSVLLQATNWMERFYTANHRYDQDVDGNLVTTSTTTGFPSSGLTKSPIVGTTKYYDISLSGVTQIAYTLNATPRSATNQTNDSCKTLTLDQAGIKGVTGGATMSVTDCWR
ncbi:type IV pilus assembly protein PilE [Gammaproteobacteria bacterium]